MKLINLLKVALLLAVSPVWASSDYLLELDGIKGESTDATHRESIEISSFSWGMSNPPIPAGGTGAGKVSISSFNFMKRTEKSSADLMLRCAMGTHIASATLFVRQAAPAGGAHPVEYCKITFSDLTVNTVEITGNSGDDRPTESFSINFAKVKVEYFPVGADGTLGEAVIFNWDVKNNVKL